MQPDRLAAAERAFRHVVVLDLPWEMMLGFNLAFYRVFAAPRVAELLDRTGEMQRRPRKRAADTGLFLYELIAAGYDTATGREVVRRLAAIHGRFAIRDADHRYVLAALVVVPTRFVALHGWRPLTAAEREASAVFWGELGRRMGVDGVPESYADFAHLLDAYERAELRPTPAGQRQLAATREVIADRLPRPLRGLAGTLTAALLDDAVLRAVGVAPAGPVARALVGAALRARAVVVRRMPRRTAPAFVPGVTGGPSYPEGYALADLGPDR